MALELEVINMGTGTDTRTGDPPYIALAKAKRNFQALEDQVNLAQGPQGEQGIQGEKGDTGASYSATSTSSVAIGSGTKTFTTQSGLAYVASQRVRVAYDASNYVEGTVTSYSGTTLIINSTRTAGSGSYTSWTIGLAGDPGAGAVDSVNGLTGAVTVDVVDLVPKKNLLKASEIRSGKYFSPAQTKIITSASYRCSPYIAVTEGETYAVSGVRASSVVAACATADDETGSFTNLGSANSSGVKVVTIPSGKNYLVVNLTDQGSGDTTYDATAQVELGSAVTAYEAYELVVPVANIQGELLESADVFEYLSHNLIDETAINYTQRYSVASNALVVDAEGIAASDWIAVTEGEWYTLSGAGMYNEASPQGGYFAAYGNTSSVDDITWVAPVAGSGKCFQVPTGQGITHAVVSLAKAGGSPSATSLAGTVQLELGELATDYQAYDLLPYFRADRIPAGTVPTATIDEAAWRTFVDAGAMAPIVGDHLPVTRAKWLYRDSDLMIVGTGTSIFARTTEHNSDHPDATTRPPLMHSLNTASLLWDRLRWEGQQYRRYDASGFFTETGSFTSASNVAEWDDGSYRAGLTRYSGDTNAAVQFVVPVDAWQFNFIYRTDSTGCTAEVTVGGGNGLMEAWNGSAWVEANAFSFSMSESARTTRSIVVPNPATGGTSTLTIPSKSNTTYQKRLKMRCRSGSIDSRASTKTVTIARTGGGARFMYWGVEWSPREFMVTYVNAARGSHSTNAESSSGLPRFADNEIWGFAPDLILGELPIHNDGAANDDDFTLGRFARLTENYLTKASYELSMLTRAAYYSLTPEICVWTSTITTQFNGIDTGTGEMLYGEATDGRKVMTALDKYAEAVGWIADNHPEIVCIHAAQRWVDAAIAIHGDLQTATAGSGKTGSTFTNEGGHPNNTGSKVLAAAIIPWITFR